MSKKLARLASAGLPVPDGFCVTTAAYHALIATADLQQALQALEGLNPEDREAVSRVATALREQLNSCPLPEAAQREVAQALAACGPEHAYAVRSSATAEDLPEASFAGQQDTYLEKGETLVAPYCDPGWTPLFLNAAGLVVDVGGLMTHGSIVAREYGLPAVVSVTEATSRIRTGQRIRVDGTRGIVQVLG